MNNRELVRTNCCDYRVAFGKAKATALDERIGDFEDSKGTQNAAGQETTGAANALGELITTGMGIRKSLDALVNNLFKGNATVIGEWATASHVERQGSRKPKPAPGGTTPAPTPKP